VTKQTAARKGSSARQAKRRHRRAKASFLALGLCALVITSACGSSSGQTATTTTSAAPAATTSGGSADSLLTQAMATVSEALKSYGGYSFPTTKVTVNGIKGKKVGIVACGPEVNCTTMSSGAAAAVTALGGTPLVNVPPNDWTASSINQTFLTYLNEGAVALIGIAWPRSFLGPTLSAAESKDVPYVAVRSGVVGPDDVNIPGGTATPEEIQGKVLADYVIDKTGGNAQVIVLQDTSQPSGTEITAGFTTEIKKCSGCTVVADPVIPEATSGTLIPSDLTNLLHKYPNVKYVYAPYDFMAELAITGINEAGAKGRVFSLGTGGSPVSLQDIKDNAGQAATISIPNQWVGWVAVDQILRLLAKMPPVHTTVPLKLVDISNITSVPLNVEWSGDVNYQAEYKAVWSVTG
jgi:ribose transport system substrate-binding protein